MPDIIITPSTGKLEFVDDSAQNIRRHAFTLDHNDGIKLDAPLSAAAVIAPLNVINVTVNNSNVNYPFVLASGSAETGTKTLMMDGSGGTYNPFTNTATIDISGNSATTTLASNSTNLGGVSAASYVTLTGTQTLTNKTITGTFTGNLTGTGSWATNAVNANTATNSTQLNGQSDSYYTNIPARLGYTPVNKAGDTISGNLTVNGNFAVNGSFTAFSASNIYLSSSVLTVEDNILTLNAFSPYLRYAGIEMYDSGSGTLSQLLWDGDGDYFFLSGSNVNGKIITGPDGQTNLSSNYIPKATAGYKLGNSLIYDNGTSLGINTTTPTAKLEIAGGTLSSQSGSSISIGTFSANNGNSGYLSILETRFATGSDWQTARTRIQKTTDVTNQAYIDFNPSGALYGFAIGTGAGGNERLRIDSTGNVGIGSTNPGYKLDVVGDIRLTSGGILRLVTSAGQERGTFQATDTTGAGGAGLSIATSGGEEIAFKDSADVNMVIKGNGNVGISTTLPASRLHVDKSSQTLGSITPGGATIISNLAAGNAILEFGVDSTNLSYIQSRNVTDQTYYKLLLNPSGGNVGIGTTSPNAKLDVNGNAIVTGSLTTTSTLTVSGLTYNESIQVDQFNYFQLQPYVEAGTFPSNVLQRSGGTTPTFTTYTGSAAPFGKVLYNTGYYEAIGDYIPVQAGETLYGEIWALRETGATGTAGGFYCGIARYDKDKNQIDGNLGLTYFITNNTGVNVPLNSTWTKYSGSTTLPLTHTPYGASVTSDGGPIRYIRPYIIVNYSSGTIPTFWGGFKIRKVQLTRDSGNVVVNGNLGIGMVGAAGQTLTVATSSRITEGASSTGVLQFGLADTLVGYNASTFNIRTYDGSGYFEALRTNGSSRYTLLAPTTGSVGIGTTSPVSILDVVGLNGTFPTGSGTIQSTGSIVRLRNGNSNLVLDIGGNGGNGNWLQSTSRSDLSLTYPLLLNPNGGYVGIGTTAFVYGAANRGLLEVYGSSDALIALRNATANFYIQKSGNNFAMVNGGAGYMAFNNNGSDRLFIDSTGNIGIGTTSVSSNLHIYSSTGPELRLSAGSNGTGGFRFIKGDSGESYINNQDSYAMRFQIAGSTRMSILADSSVGIGTTVPAARLQVNSTTAGATLLRTDGTNGTLFSVVDDLSDSLMSVNNSAGLPVLEVFADDRVVMGQYGQNDFVVRNNKVGIGTNNPQFKLDVTGSLGVNASSLDTNWAFVVSDNSSAGSRYSLNKLGSMGFNNADNYAQLQLLGSSGAYVDFTNSVGGDSNARLIYYAGSRLDLTYGFATTITLNSTGVGIGTTLPTTALHVVGVISGSSFSGAGTGLTGTAANLTAGTATIANGVSTGAVKSGGLEENSVITSKIADGNVTNVKLASSSVTIGSSAVSLGSTLTTIAGLTSVTSTTFVGALTGTGSWATNAVTALNGGVTSIVAGTSISISGGTGAVTVNNSSPNATHTGDVTGATTLTIANDAVTTVKILNANVTNAKLANSSVTIGSTAISLGATATTIAGLTSVTSTTFVGALTGNVTGNVTGTAGSETFATVTGRGASTTTQISVGTTAGGSMYTGIKSGAGYSDAVSGATFKSITDHPTGGSYAFAAYFNGSPGTGTNSFFVAADGTGYFKGSVGIGTTAPQYPLDISGSNIRSFSTAGGAEPGFIADYPSSNGYGGFFIHVNNTRRWRIGSVGDTNVQPALNFWQEGTGSRMIITNTGNVGIGTTSPSSRVHIYENANRVTYITQNNNHTARFEAYGTATAIDTTASNGIFFRINGGDIVKFAADGNVGIGTNTVTAKVESYFSSNAVTINYLATNLNNNSPIPVYGFDVTNGSGETRSIKAGIGYERHLTNGRGTLHFYNDSTNDTQSLSGNRTSAGDIKMSIDNDGNVGIGSVTPAYKLHVMGNGYFSSTLQVNSNITLSGGGDVIINDSDGTGTFNSFMDSGIGYIRIDDGGSANGKLNINSGLLYVGASGGNVGISSTTPGYKLDVVGDINFSSTLKFGGINVVSNAGGDVYLNGRVIRNESNTSQDGMYIGYNSTGTTNAHIRFFANATNERMRIQANDGNVGIGTTTAGQKLDVEGRIRTRGASGTGGFEIGAATTGTAKWRIEWDSASDSLDFNWVG